MKYGTHGYTGKGKRSGSKKNRAGNIVPQLTRSDYLYGEVEEKQMARRPAPVKAPIFPSKQSAETVAS